MTVPCFLDTNILIYAASKDEPRKRKIANSLIDGGAFGLSAQVLAEFYATSTRKMRPPLSTDTARAWVDLLSQQHCVAVDAGIVKSGIEVSERYGISYWDGAIIAAAEAAGAPVVYTEDLNHGQVYGTVTAINPFVDHETGFHEPKPARFEGAG